MDAVFSAWSDAMTANVRDSYPAESSTSCGHVCRTTLPHRCEGKPSVTVPCRLPSGATMSIPLCNACYQSEKETP